MKNAKVLVIGSTGMLGSAVTSELLGNGVHVLEASRSRGYRFDAEVDSVSGLFELSGLGPEDYVVNCVGLTKGRIDHNFPRTIELAAHLNIMFPIALARAAERREIRVIQVATDCVFSGVEGKYRETSLHDAVDAYGKTKSLGETVSPNVMHLRCSLIGPELEGRKSLFFEWVRQLGLNATVQGFNNHAWNGLTSQAFGRVVHGLVKSQNFYPGVQHLVPADCVSKFKLIELELELLGRTDVRVEQFATEEPIDRTLETNNPELNQRLFNLGGYETIPSIREMMGALSWSELGKSAGE